MRRGSSTPLTSRSTRRRRAGGTASSTSPTSPTTRAPPSPRGSGWTDRAIARTMRARMFDIGGSLAAARRGRGLTLPDVEALTRIRQKQLEAIEAERWDELPGRAYARAFLRSYANALDLEADLYVAEFEAQVPEEEDVVAPAPVRRRRRFPVRAAVTGAATATVIGIVAWGGGGGQAPAEVPAFSDGVANAAPTAHPRRRAKAAPKAVDRRVVIRAAR